MAPLVREGKISIGLVTSEATYKMAVKRHKCYDDTNAMTQMIKLIDIGETSCINLIN